MLYDIKIVHVFRVEREIIVQVEADSAKAAVQLQDELLEAPGHDDPGWKTEWNLQNEEVTNV